MKPVLQLFAFKLTAILTAVFLLEGSAFCQEADVGRGTKPVFSRTGDSSFAFDTGVIRGRLHALGKSLGLTEVTHIPSGKRLDRSNGLLSHYRVFTRDTRYGGGAWDWPSDAKLLDNGSVLITWPAEPTRPFSLQAIYSWRDASTIDLETVVSAREAVSGFESFVASYFSSGFSNAAVYLENSPENNKQPAFLATRHTYGQWLMFPREESVIPLIRDGRWRLEPNPVDWTIMPYCSKPICYRREPTSGLTVVLMSRPSDAFAIACPHQAEGHYSMYYSLFGRNLKAGEVVRARIRMQVVNASTEAGLLNMYEAFLNDKR